MGWSDLFFLHESILLCEKCRAGLQLIDSPICPGCGRLMKEPNLCNDCVAWQTDADFGSVLRFNRSLYVYNDFLKDLIARFKYRGDYELARIFANDLKKRLPKADYIVPIPLSQNRLLERGFNQAEAIGVVAGLTLTDGLIRIHAEKQAKKNRYQRLHSKQVFRIHPEAPDLSDKTVVLLDDIYTTGTTLRHAAYILKVSGAKDIFSVTIAR